MTEWRQSDQGSQLVKSREVMQFSVEPESRESLRQDVKKRFLLMLEAGLVQEVERLLDLKQMDSKKSSMKSVGYRQICDYLEGKTTYEEMIVKAVNATRQLAKRQMTWLRGWKNLHWVSQDTKASVKLIEKKLRLKK
jgi:tRNA dimethylallyltransferase